MHTINSYQYNFQHIVTYTTHVKTNTHTQCRTAIEASAHLFELAS